MTRVHPTWRSDEHGTYSLRPATADGEGHVWIQGRRPYCDRGHWEWGTMGLHADRVAHPEPSYYFMRMDTALAEVEAWLARCAGRVVPDPGVLAEGPFAHGAAVALAGTWVTRPSGGMEARLPDSDTRLTLVPVTTPSGPMFRLDAEHVPHLDESDAFPRLYLTATAAQQEAEEFLAWRLLRRPAETPGFVSLPPRPLGGVPNPMAPEEGEPRLRRPARP